MIAHINHLIQSLPMGLPIVPMYCDDIIGSTKEFNAARCWH